jgi:isopentenyl-diphosphate delta-isomerase
MPEVTPSNKSIQISDRKSDHIRINLDQDVRSGLTTGLEYYHFIHHALPELNLEEVDTTTGLFGKQLRAPILISSMTGGTPEAAAINRILATAAQEMGVAMGVGSQRAAIEHTELANTFQVRPFAPDILLFANLGAIQLNYHLGIDHCQQAVDMIQADALILHFNALQEAVQAEGQTRFSGLLKKIEAVCHYLSVPVIAKEVGWGFCEADVLHLLEVGVAAIDVAGAGGTSWSQVEMHRASNESQARLAASFVDWGTPTADAICNVRRVAPNMPIIASGGLRSGVDIAKCLALGAVLGGMAGPFLKAAAQSLEMTIQTIQEVWREIQVCMFATGSKNLTALMDNKLVLKR